jgi:hypothetical protein
MSDFEIHVDGADEIRDRLLRFRAATVLTETADTIRPGLVAALKLACPKDTGTMADRIRAERRTSLIGEASVDLKASTDVDYAPYVLYGTRPHWILPRSAQALHWVDQSGDDVFAAAVHHPGNKPNDFPRRVWVGLREPVLAELTARIAERLWA